MSPPSQNDGPVLEQPPETSFQRSGSRQSAQGSKKWDWDKTHPHSSLRRAEACIALIECFEEYYGTNRPGAGGCHIVQSMLAILPKRRRRSALSVATTFEKYEDLQR